jgi:hypothetical protein
MWSLYLYQMKCQHLFSQDWCRLLRGICSSINASPPVSSNFVKLSLDIHSGTCRVNEMKYYYNKMYTALVYRVNQKTQAVHCFGGASVWASSNISASFIHQWLTEITFGEAKQIYPNISWLRWNLW